MPPKNNALSPSPDRIKEHWSELCRRIGERRAGSAGDRAAAEYVLNEFRQAGLHNVHAEPFPCVSVAKASAVIALEKEGVFQEVPARVLAGSSGTPASRQVEADLVWVEMPEQAERLHGQPFPNPHPNLNPASRHP